MKAYPTFTAVVEQDKLNLPDGFKSFLKTNFKVGQEVWLQLTPKKKVRSDKQNNYYWLYLQVISDETGNNLDDLHQLFKRKLLPPRFQKILGEVVAFPATTTNLKSDEFSEYIKRIEALTGIPAPTPEWER